jgi:hypothetical protein
MAKGNPIGWWEITGKDAGKTQKFYADLFGWNIDANNPMKYGMVMGEGHAVGGGISGNAPDGSTGVTIYVDVDDMQATLDKATSLGGSVVVPIMEVEGQGGLKIAQFKDPDGNVVGIMKPPAM